MEKRTNFGWFDIKQPGNGFDVVTMPN